MNNVWIISDCFLAVILLNNETIHASWATLWKCAGRSGMIMLNTLNTMMTENWCLDITVNELKLIFCNYRDKIFRSPYNICRIKIHEDSSIQFELVPLVRKPNTCLKFPLDGRAFVENLHINTSRLLISCLVISVSLKDFPSSKDPVH